MTMTKEELLAAVGSGDPMPSRRGAFVLVGS